MKGIVLNDTPKCRSRLSKMAHKTHRTRISKNVLYSTTLQTVGVGCPKWFWCSAVRAGRGIGTSLAEREHYTEDIVRSRCPICPKCCLKILSEIGSIMLNDTPKCRSRLSKMVLV
ncbi:MAG: hypothetical protein WC721_11360 [Victivallaceae bacterium]